MKTTPARFAAIIFLAAGIFFAGYLANRQEVPAASSASSKQAATYTCPMHPQYTSDRASDCPICGMRLVRANTGETDSKLDPASSDANGMIKISAARQQLIGVRTDEVRRASAVHQLRVPGRITVDDQRLYRVIAATDGWILDLGPDTVGRFVRNGQLLATYYSRDLLAAEQLFLVSLGSSESSQKGSALYGSLRTGASLIPQYPVDTMRGLGMSDRQIEEVERTRTPATRINIYAPADGFVLARDVSPGQRFEKGAEFYRIADIRHVWVLTDIFEKDREFVKPGATATVRYQGREFEARLSDALPQLDPQTRTLQTRFELDNPGNFLLPDMFVDVEVHVEMPEALTIPADSVIDLGRRKTVYVETADDAFEPRLIQTGWRLGDRVQVTSGLQPGERIVVSSNFLVDSESRMKLAAATPAPSVEEAAAAKDLVCGMDVDPKSPDTLKTQWNSKTYYFCSPKCKKDFEENPGKYVRENMAAPDGSGARDH